MSDIYRGGTIGKAKEDLERTAKELNTLISDKYNGEALISVSKAVATKASVFIPGMPTYGCILFDEMKKNGTHETIVQHKFRLYNDMVYGDKRLLDDQGRIRLDSFEMDETVQSTVLSILKEIGDNEEKLFALSGSKEFIGDFYRMNGFEVNGVDYDKEVDLDTLSAIELI
jgi:enoyl-[acyl-carrier protein] reductase/trans-2-enoyl-CoA reductase (NAD+)